MDLRRDKVRPRRFTLLDVVFLVGVVALTLGAVSSVGRSELGLGAAWVFTASTVAIHVLTWFLFLVAGSAVATRTTWQSIGLFGFYLLVGLTFLIQVTLLILVDPLNGLMVIGSVLGMLFYWVSWS
jgi:hypothetical protein